MNIGLRVVSLLLAFYLVLFFVVAGLSNFDNAEQYPVLQIVIESVEAVEVPATALIRENLPSEINGRDVAPWMFIFTVAPPPTASSSTPRPEGAAL